jgi:hypothetical protein
VSFCDVQEEEKYEAVEKEYETVAELAKEDELELRCVVIIQTAVADSLHQILTF